MLNTLPKQALLLKLIALPNVLKLNVDTALPNLLKERME
jgi:hypothetical protein